MKKGFHKWWDVVVNYDSEPLQLANISILISWALFFGLGVGEFAASPTYQVLQSYAQEELWASVALVISVIWLVGFFLERTSIICWAAFFASAFWLVLSGSTLAANSHSWAGIVTTLLSIQAAWVYLRRGV